MKAFLTALLLCTGIIVHGQALYSRAFGNPAAKPVIFLHGGPGYNSASFEASAAQNLADSGFYVIVYDRRGEGRSPDAAAAFTYQQTFDDLEGIYKKYGIRKAVLMGHSFGGIIATLYAKAHPGNVRSVVLVSAPVSLQESFRTIQRESKAIYEAKSDTANLKYIDFLSKMDTASLAYMSYNFRHAMVNGFYSPKKPTAEAQAVYAGIKKDSLARYLSQMTMPAPAGFLKNEHYTSLNLASALQALVAGGMPVYGLYGKEDGLYSAAQVAALGRIIGTGQLRYFDNCSHSIFIDQQAAFIAALRQWYGQL